MRTECYMCHVSIGYVSPVNDVRVFIWIFQNTDLRRLSLLHINTGTLGDRCETTAHCSNAIQQSTCVEGVCACEPGHHADDVTSCTLRKLGQSPCTTTEDCTHAVNNSFCNEEGICACQLGYRTDDDTSSCVLRKIGDSTCETEADCRAAIPDSACEYGQCVCVLGYHPNHALTSCKRRSLGDRTCVIEEDCSAAVSNSTCENYMCVCQAGHEGNEDRDTCVAREIGSNCTTQRDCSAAYDFGVCVEERSVSILFHFIGQRLENRNFFMGKRSTFATVYFHMSVSFTSSGTQLLICSCSITIQSRH